MSGLIVCDWLPLLTFHHGLICYYKIHDFNINYLSRSETFSHQKISIPDNVQTMVVVVKGAYMPRIKYIQKVKSCLHKYEKSYTIMTFKIHVTINDFC